MPVPLIAVEIAAAVRQMHGTPVYAGIETLSYPGVIDVDAPMVRQLVHGATIGIIARSALTLGMGWGDNSLIW